MKAEIATIDSACSGNIYPFVYGQTTAAVESACSGTMFFAYGQSH